MRFHHLGQNPSLPPTGFAERKAGTVSQYIIPGEIFIALPQYYRVGDGANVAGSL